MIALPVTDHRGMGHRGQEAENVRDVLSAIAHRVVVHDKRAVGQSITEYPPRGTPLLTRTTTMRLAPLRRSRQRLDQLKGLLRRA